MEPVHPTTFVELPGLAEYLGLLSLTLAYEGGQPTGSVSYQAACAIVNQVSQDIVVAQSFGNFGSALANICQPGKN